MLDLATALGAAKVLTALGQDGTELIHERQQPQQDVACIGRPLRFVLVWHWTAFFACVFQVFPANLPDSIQRRPRTGWNLFTSITVEHSQRTVKQKRRPRCLHARVNPNERLSRRSEEHTSELQSLRHLVCRLLLEKQ